MAADGEGDPPQDHEQDRSSLIAHFQEITGIDDHAKVVQLLSSRHWELEAAVHDAFNEKEGVPSVFAPDPHPGAPPPSLQPGVRRRPMASSAPGRGPVDAPPTATPHGGGGRSRGGAVVAQRQNWWEWLVNVAIFPLRFVLNTASDLLQFVIDLVFGFQPTARNPLADVRQFVLEFESEYGRTHPPFVESTYEQAVSQARQDLQFLLVYLHSPSHQDTPRFCREVLCSQQLVDFAPGQLLLWGISVHSEEGVRVSYILRESTYPFLALIVLKQGRMVVCERVEGAIGLDDLLARLRAAIANNEGELVVERTERARREEDQRLREAQDEAYQLSLAADREKERLRVEALEKEQAEVRQSQEQEREEQKKEEEFEIERAVRISRLPVEPEASSPTAVQVLLRLPSGQRLERRFTETDNLESVYDFAYTAERDQLPHKFILITNFPRRELHPSADGGPALGDLGLGRKCVLFVHDISD